MRLIDADDFKKFMQALCKAGCPYESFIELLDKQTTAYDIGKVVKELEESSKWVNETNEYCDDDGNDYIPLSKAIEIIKQGCVSDDACEWKQTSTARYKTSCGYRLEEFFDTNACYCKQCGKKIKVVE